MLARLAVNENADFSNNSTGTLVGLFFIGPESAATEASPEARLPALLTLLQSSNDAERRLGLKAIRAALDSRGRGFRIVGPEYQGLKERASLWKPATYADWWQARLVYFQTLVTETRKWSNQRAEVCQALMNAVEQQIKTPPCTELAFQVLDALVNDDAMSSRQLNRFFWHWQEREKDDLHLAIAVRLRAMARRFTQRSLASRFQRYVIDVDWMEWNEDFRQRHNKPKTRARLLVSALARRIARRPEILSHVEHLVTEPVEAPGLWHFGEELARNDEGHALLPELARLTKESKHQVCLHGYLHAARAIDPAFYESWIEGALSDRETAWLGASIALRSDYVDDLFVLCLDALEKGWIDPVMFGSLRYGNEIAAVPPERASRLLRLLSDIDTTDSLRIALDLLASTSFDENSPCSSDFVFDVLFRTIPREDSHDQMHGYYWKEVSSKLVKWDASHSVPLLDALLTAMGEAYHLSYHSDVVPLADELVRLDAQAAWEVVRVQFERSLPQWRSDLFSWLKGGLASFDEKASRGSIAELPVSSILEWIEQDIEPRAALIAHAAPGTLDADHGGRLTRELLSRYGTIDGVRDGISATFHSGSWSGPASAYLKRKRERFRRWLSAGFEFEVAQWIEAEISYLDRRIEREETHEERSRFD